MGERDARENFARAVDRLDGAGADSGDSELDAELAVVRDLRRAGTAPVSDQETRRTVAALIAGKIAQPDQTANPEPVEPGLARRRRPRPALAAVFCLLAGLGGLAVLLAESALPGDTLYPLKRARESAVLALTFDDQERAQQRLTYAADRVDELGRLVERDGDSAKRGAATGFADFESAARAASAALTSMAAGTDGDQLGTLRSWAVRQSHQLTELTPALTSATVDEQGSSLALLDRIEHRVTALHERLDCYRITSGDSDELGALPATGPCLPPGQKAGDQQVPAPAPSPSPSPPKEEPPPDTLASSPVAGQADAPPERVGVRGPVRVPNVPIAAPAPVRFEPHPPVLAPPPIDRPRVPGDAGDAPEAEHGLAGLVEPVRGLVDEVLGVPLGE